MHRFVRPALLAPTTLCLALIAFARPSAAQRDSRISAGVSVVVPVGDMSNRWTVGYGGGAAYQHALGAAWSMDVAVNYDRFPERNDLSQGLFGEANFLTALGFAGGVRRYFVRGRLYAGLNAAYYFISTRIGDDEPFVKDQPGVLPTLGLRTDYFDLGAEYKLAGTAHWVLIHGAVRVRY